MYLWSQTIRSALSSSSALRIARGTQQNIVIIKQIPRKRKTRVSNCLSVRTNPNSISKTTRLFLSLNCFPLLKRSKKFSMISQSEFTNFSSIDETGKRPARHDRVPRNHDTRNVTAFQDGLSVSDRCSNTLQLSTTRNRKKKKKKTLAIVISPNSHSYFLLIRSQLFSLSRPNQEQRWSNFSKSMISIS